MSITAFTFSSCCCTLLLVNVNFCVYCNFIVIWKLITQDWVALYSSSSSSFLWFREIVKSYVRLVDTSILYMVLHVLLPWRRELQRKIFTEISDSAEIINYAQPMDVPRVVLDDYVELFVIVMLEIIRRSTFVFLYYKLLCLLLTCTCTVNLLYP